MRRVRAYLQLSLLLLAALQLLAGCRPLPYTVTVTNDRDDGTFSVFYCIFDGAGGCESTGNLAPGESLDVTIYSPSGDEFLEVNGQINGQLFCATEYLGGYSDGGVVSLFYLSFQDC